MLVLIITSGYAIVRTSIPGWWVWAYWISPFAYGLRAVVINEMTSPGWNAIQAGTTETVGVYSLKSFGFFTERSVARAVLHVSDPPRASLHQGCGANIIFPAQKVTKLLAEEANGFVRS